MSIKIENISKRYGSLLALDRVSFEIKDRNVYLLLGPNGAGKTSLIKVILGLLFPDSGRVVKKNNYKIAYIMEEKIGKREWKVSEYLEYIGRINKLRGKTLNNKINNALDEVKINEKTRKNFIKNLSKGQKQRIKWASAIILNYEINVFDEPTSGLDPIGKKDFRDWVKKERKKGKTFLISSHLIEEMEKVGDNFVILHKGRIKKTGNVIHLKGNELADYFYKLVGSEEGEK